MQVQALRTPRRPFPVSPGRSLVDHVEPLSPARERKLNVDDVAAKRSDFDHRSLLGSDSGAQLNLRVAVPVILVVAVAHDCYRHHFLRLGVSIRQSLYSGRGGRDVSPDSQAEAEGRS